MWDDIVEEETPSRLSSDDELRSLESTFGIVLPADHRAFLGTFGEGVLFNHVRIFGTGRILAQAASFRERWREYFLWDDDDSALDERALAECVIIGDTFNGDEFVLSPSHSQIVFYLPQDSSTILQLGDSLERAIGRFIADLRQEVSRYPEEEREEWDLRPVFSVSSF